MKCVWILNKMVDKEFHLNLKRPQSSCTSVMRIVAFDILPIVRIPNDCISDFYLLLGLFRKGSLSLLEWYVSFIYTFIPKH